MRNTLLVCIFLLCFAVQKTEAQENTLLNLLNDSLTQNGVPDYVTATFKATRLVNQQTIESPAAGNLNFIIQHRFGQLNNGAYNFFGLDNATMRLGFDYGITDRLAAGVGRSSYQKTFDGYLKYKLVRQRNGARQIPVTVSILGSISNYTLQFADKPFLNTEYRTAYTSQLLIARKFNRNFSVQLTPTYIHYNLVATTQDKNDVFAITGGTRLKITKRMSIEAEYNYLPINQVVSMPIHNSFSLGWGIETGGHVFQLIFTNSQSMVASQYIAQTQGSWGNGDIYFGFNLSRIFTLTKHSKLHSDWK
jgi:hypothetical protein